MKINFDWFEVNFKLSCCNQLTIYQLSRRPVDVGTLPVAGQ